jgi:hypothetical protein
MPLTICHSDRSSVMSIKDTLEGGLKFAFSGQQPAGFAWLL